MKGFCGIAYHEGNFFLTGSIKKCRKLICWNEQMGCIWETDIPTEEKKFLIPLFIQDTLLLFPALSEAEVLYIHKVDLKKKCVEKYDDLERLIQKKDNRKIYIGWPKLSENKIKFSTVNDGLWHEYDYENKLCCEYEFVFDVKQYILKLMKLYRIKQKNTVLDEKKIPLECFVSYIQDVDEVVEDGIS